MCSAVAPAKRTDICRLPIAEQPGRASIPNPCSLAHRLKVRKLREPLFKRRCRCRGRPPCVSMLRANIDCMGAAGVDALAVALDRTTGSSRILGQCCY